MIRRYLVFAGLRYYPNGGWSDFVGSYDTLEEAQQAATDKQAWFIRTHNDWWWHIVDQERGGVIKNDAGE